MTQPLIFKDVAKDIIKETISNAIFIDDKAILPFQSPSTSPKLKSDHHRCIALYNDFKSKDCLLLISKFTKRTWNKDKGFNLNNKDLLILDWQLVGEKHEESLKILDQSVIKKGLHFGCIYTQASLQEVKIELNRFYLGKLTDTEIKEIRELFSDTDLNDIWKLDDTANEAMQFDELINSIVNAREEEQAGEISAFKEAYSLDDGLMEAINGLSGKYPGSAFVKLRTALSKKREIFTKIPEKELIYRLSETDNNTIYINHTIVKLFQKDAVSGDQLYDSLFDSIMEEKNIFLTLMGLEMRNRFRENSAFIGKDLDSVSEEAFFFHRTKNLEFPHIFEDFLREILKDQVASFLYEKDLKIFDSLANYSEVKGMSAKTAVFEADKNRLVDESFKLNKFYNLININSRKANDNLRFGDIFTSIVAVPVKDPKTQKVTIENLLRYFICITPLCDCLRPSKINYQFWFVEGQEETGQEGVLKGTDGKFFSFVRAADKVIAIDWKNKREVMPFAMTVKNTNVSKKLATQYFGQNIKLELVASLKENYAQRIANEAFGYPIRVGIDFVKKS